MKNYNLDDQLNKKIVFGLVNGYQDYLDVRKEKFEKMKISGAYAWVKGNHIENRFADACESEGIAFQIAKAGLAWQYLEFTHENDKILFIVKNGRYFSKNEVSLGKQIKGTPRKKPMYYLEKLMNINNNIPFNDIELAIDETNQLELIEDVPLTENDNQEISKLRYHYDRFYIFTYEIDENYMISNISLFMPNPHNNKAYKIADLTNYISDVPQKQIEARLRKQLKQTDEVDNNYTAHEFGIIAADDSEEKSN